ncbi:MAG: tetratricopeptide repeat protein [Myxococcota bacterium]
MQLYKFKSNFLIILAIVFISLLTMGCKSKKKGKTVPDSKNDKTQNSQKNDKVDQEDQTSSSSGEQTQDYSDEKSGNKLENDQTLDKTDAEEAGSSNKKPGEQTKTDNRISKEQKLKKKLRKNLRKARSLLQKGDKNSLEKAIKLCSKILGVNYNHIETVQIIARAQFQLERYGKMLAALDRIKEIRQKMNPPTKPSGFYHLLKGRYHLKLAREYRKKGFLLKSETQMSRAKKEFATKAASSMPMVKFIKGSLALERGEHQKGLHLLESAGRSNSDKLKNNWKYQFNLSVAYLKTGEYAKAEKKLNYILNTLNSKCHNCHYNLALIYSRWDKVPDLGNLSKRDRADLVIKHAGKYISYMRRNKSSDKHLEKILLSWIKTAKSKK